MKWNEMKWNMFILFSKNTIVNENHLDEHNEFDIGKSMLSSIVIKNKSHIFMRINAHYTSSEHNLSTTP